MHQGVPPIEAKQTLQHLYSSVRCVETNTLALVTAVASMAPNAIDGDDVVADSPPPAASATAASAHLAAASDAPLLLLSGTPSSAVEAAETNNQASSQISGKLFGTSNALDGGGHDRQNGEGVLDEGADTNQPLLQVLVNRLTSVFLTAPKRRS